MTTVMFFLSPFVEVVSGELKKHAIRIEPKKSFEPFGFVALPHHT